MSALIRWGILGTGAMAIAFARELARLSGARVQAVGSRDAARAAAVARRLGIPRAHGTYREVMTDPDVDVIYVATLNPSHAELSLACLDAGKPVLCEKPFALNAAQARSVVARARDRRLFCMEAMWMRFVPAVARLKHLLEAGAIGTPRLLAAHIGYPFLADPTGRQFDPVLGGGALLDLGVYPLSLAFHLFGAPERVTGRATLAVTGVDETDVIVLDYADGRTALLTASLATGAPNDAVVMGTSGHIRLHEPFYRSHGLTIRSAPPLAPRAGDGGRAAHLTRVRWVHALLQRLDVALSSPGRRGVQRLAVPLAGTGYRHEAAEVMRCLREGRLESPLMPLDESVRILDAMDLLRRQWNVCFAEDERAP